MMTYRYLYRVPLACTLAMAVLCPWLAYAAGESKESRAASVGAGKALSNKAQVSDDTPEAAIRSFYTALGGGDADAASRIVESPKNAREWIEVQVSVSNAFRHLGKAAVARFGEEGKLLQVNPQASVLKILVDNKPLQDGDSAEWRVNPKAPMKLTRTNGHWKLDVLASFVSPEKVAEYNAAFRDVAELLEQYAADIENGKYQSVAEVRAEMNKKKPSGPPSPRAPK
jgi:hypothetical protein